MFKGGIGSLAVSPRFSCVRGGSLPTRCTGGWFPATSAAGALHHQRGRGKRVHTVSTVCHLPGALWLWLCINTHLKMPIPFPCPAEVSLSGEVAGGVLQSQVTAPRPTSSRPGCFGCPFYRRVPLLHHISLLGCAYSSRHGVKNTSLPLIIHLSRSRQDFDLKGKAFPEIRLHETHAKRAPRHQPLTLLGKF